MAGAVAATESRRTNRLLCGFLVISLMAHAWVLARIAGIYESRDTAYIELEMRNIDKPRDRAIPVPPRRRQPPPVDVPRVTPTRPPPSVPTAPPTAERPTSVAAVSKPAAPVAGAAAIVPWAPPAAAAGDAGAAEAGSGTSADDYFEMVRWRVESRKEYPAAAKRRNMQGRVVVRFVIDSDGSVGAVSIAEPSRYRLLNEAAMAAVASAAPFPRPPAHLFGGPLPLEIGIVFELM